MAHSFFEFRIINQAENKMEFDSRLEVVFVLTGKGSLRLQQSNAYYQLKKGDIFVINQFQTRSIAMTENSLAISLYIDTDFIVKSAPEIGTFYFECKSFLYGDHEQQLFDNLREAFAQVFYCFFKTETGLSIEMRSKVFEMLVILFNSFLDQNHLQQITGHDQLRQVLYYVHKNYQNAISLRDISYHVALSDAYLSRMFKSYVNQTLSDYITELRIAHAQTMLLTDRTITDIAYESGFPSHNAMISAFKKFKGLTPKQYREEACIQKKTSPTEQFIVDGFSTAFGLLLSYLDEYTKKKSGPRPDIQEVFVNTRQTIGDTPKSWKRIVNIGYAKTVLKKQVQQQVELLQKKVGFEYLRIKGLLDDDMMVYSYGIDGSLQINYIYVDEVIDFILDMKAKPFIEIGHMPSLLAQSTIYKIRQGSVLSPTKNLDAWFELILSLMNHLKNRYGQEQLSSWLFSPWISADYVALNIFSEADYQNTYLKSFRAIKNTIPNAKICGPGSILTSRDRLRCFLNIAKQENALPDIISLKSYASVEPKDEEEALDLNVTPDAFPFAVSKDENYLATHYHEVVSVLKELDLDHLPVLIEEWSNNVWQRDLANDTLYKSCYVFKNVLQSSGFYYGLAYQTLNDQLDEVPPSKDIFCGGFGIFTRNSIPKSVFYAYQLLAKQGDKLLMQGDGYYVCKSKEAYQIYLYNYTHYDMLYRYRHTTNLSLTERYGVFNKKDDLSYHFQLTALDKGYYEIVHHTIDDKHGSAYDVWLAMGAPSVLSDSEREYLVSKSWPEYCKKSVNTEGVINISTNLKPHHLKLIEIRKINQ